MSSLPSLSSTFLSLLVYYVTFYRPSEVDPGQRPVDLPSELLLPSYDFIIVGGGSAGSVLASRLSEEAWTVLLIEAGGPETVLSDVPLLGQYLWSSPLDWNYFSTPQKRSCKAEGVCRLTRGKVLGGSSTINAMIYNRGHPFYYDKWASMGNPGWSYEEVLPYFRKSEDVQVEELLGSEYHSTEGYLTVKYSEYQTKISGSFIEAAEKLGAEKTDPNGERQGVSRMQFTMRGGSRCSASKAFLNPARNRTNLHILMGALCTKLQIDSGKVTGVEFTRDGTEYTVTATKEVILAAGVFNTPQLLMLSGVGPAKHLKQMGIPVVRDLPVGDNLQDHPLFSLEFLVNNSDVLTPSEVLSEDSILEYSMDGGGPLTVGYGNEAQAYFKSGITRSSVPDMFVVFGSYYVQENDTKIMYLLPHLVNPESRGTVRLRSTNASDPPVIDVNYWATVQDRKIGRKLCDIAERLILSNNAFRKYSPVLFLESKPACSGLEGGSLCSCIIEQYSATSFHPVGTVKMGPGKDPTAVVAPDLRVHGMSGLRVVDSSIMPLLPNGNPNAATIMIAEKAADIIKQHWLKS